MSVDVYALVVAHADALSGGAVAALEANDLFNQLAEEMPEALAAMLHEHGPFLFTQIIRDRLRSVRAAGMAGKAAEQFGESAADFEAGRLSADEFTGAFAIPYRVGPDGAVKRAGEMSGSDHLYVSRNYSESAKTFKLRASVHAAIAKKVGDRRTDEVYTEAEYAALMRSCSPGSGAPAT